MSIDAVFASWHNDRAVAYRRLHDIPEDWGTAVNVQAMVFGNRGEDSGTGVVFTRDPSTGDKYLYGEFLPNAQGEDVVAGIRDPAAYRRAARVSCREVYDELAAGVPAPGTAFPRYAGYRIHRPESPLYLLQTRSGQAHGPGRRAYCRRNGRRKG